MNRLLTLLMVIVLAVTAFGHPPSKKLPPTKAAKAMAASAKALEKYRKSLTVAGKYGCCVKPPAGSKVEGCAMCAIKNGSCQCGLNLAKGKGVCGECKGMWKNGKGAFPIAQSPFKKVDDIPVLSSNHQGMDMGTEKEPTPNPLRAEYLASVLEVKKTLVAEKRFSCCVGQGGCDECALEGACACGANLAAGQGVCGQCLDGQHAGIGRIPGVVADDVQVEAMDMDMPMRGTFSLNMNQEGSGTSWLPSSSPMLMKSLGTRGGFDFNAMGLATLNYADAGGKRGESKFFTSSMGMLMAQRGNLGLRVMGSLDAVTNGKQGYPLLFQTGETANGKPLKDRQHPHDLIMEAAATYSTPISPAVSGFVYLAPIGEPALGTAAFQHRPSASENPEAPITHHWNDGTHISFGVVTGGLTFGDRWKLDGSVFNGREPNENRYDFDPIRLNSYSGRLSYNPSANWSFSTSYGFLKSPESLEPGVNQHRVVAAGFYEGKRGETTYSAGLIYGRNIKSDHASDAWNLEGTAKRGPDTYFSRLEYVDKDELVDVPAESYRIGKLSLGYIRDFKQSDGLTYGVGAYLGLYSVPGSLRPYYGSNPVSFGIFLRIK